MSLDFLDIRYLLSDLFLRKTDLVQGANFELLKVNSHGTRCHLRLRSLWESAFQDNVIGMTLDHKVCRVLQINSILPQHGKPVHDGSYDPVKWPIFVISGLLPEELPPKNLPGKFFIASNDAF